MEKQKAVWKKARGKLGIFEPLIGAWVAQAKSPMGPVKCTRTFERVLGKNYVQLTARWEFAGKGAYEELAIIGIGADKKVHFWSFTSDGKRSEGWLAKADDLHPEAIAFEADMPAGHARMAYWPDEETGGFRWVVESKNKKGWNRFVEHQYRKSD